MKPNLPWTHWHFCFVSLILGAGPGLPRWVASLSHTHPQPLCLFFWDEVLLWCGLELELFHLCHPRSRACVWSLATLHFGITVFFCQDVKYTHSPTAYLPVVWWLDSTFSGPSWSIHEWVISCPICLLKPSTHVKCFTMSTECWISLWVVSFDQISPWITEL